MLGGGRAVADGIVIALAEAAFEVALRHPATVADQSAFPGVPAAVWMARVWGIRQGFAGVPPRPWRSLPQRRRLRLHAVRVAVVPMARAVARRPPVDRQDLPARRRVRWRAAPGGAVSPCRQRPPRPGRMGRRGRRLDSGAGTGPRTVRYLLAGRLRIRRATCLCPTCRPGGTSAVGGVQSAPGRLAGRRRRLERDEGVAPSGYLEPQARPRGQASIPVRWAR